MLLLDSRRRLQVKSMAEPEHKKAMRKPNSVAGDTVRCQGRRKATAEQHITSSR